MVVSVDMMGESSGYCEEVSFILQFVWFVGFGLRWLFMMLLSRTSSSYFHNYIFVFIDFY